VASPRDGWGQLTPFGMGARGARRLGLESGFWGAASRGGGRGATCGE
jgi:hypothetical protein